MSINVAAVQMWGKIITGVAIALIATGVGYNVTETITLGKSQARMESKMDVWGGQMEREVSSIKAEAQRNTDRSIDNQRAIDRWSSSVVTADDVKAMERELSQMREAIARLEYEFRQQRGLP